MSNLNKGKDVRFLFCDISNTFDRVWHKGLIHKWSSFRIPDRISNRVKNYLIDRKQRVVLDGFIWTFGSTTGGFFLFLFFWSFFILININDISTNLVNNVRLYADDTFLYVIDDANSLTSDSDQLIEPMVKTMGCWFQS